MICLTLLANNKSFLTESDLKESSSQKMKYGLQIELKEYFRKFLI